MRIFSGRILLPDLGFPILLSRKMGFNLTTRPSEGIVMNLALGIDTKTQPIHNGIGKLKQLIR